jgi:putative phosphoribosyl transferase
MTITATNRIEIPLKNGDILRGILEVPPNAQGLVIFSHGSGSSSESPRNRFVAQHLNNHAIATLLVDLLTYQEDEVYDNRFDIDLLTERLVNITTWAMHEKQLKGLKIGYFGASTGAASALRAATQLPKVIKAIVSRGGRPNLAETALSKVKAPTLLIVGSMDMAIAGMNTEAYKLLTCEKQLLIIKGASHLFAEKSKLEEVATSTNHWFTKYFK